VATLVANLGENFIVDGGFTISYVLFAMILIIAGAGRYSLDYFLLKKASTALFTLPRSISKN